MRALIAALLIASVAHADPEKLTAAEIAQINQLGTELDAAKAKVEAAQLRLQLAFMQAARAHKLADGCEWQADGTAKCPTTPAPPAAKPAKEKK